MLVWELLWIADSLLICWSESQLFSCKNLLWRSDWLLELFLGSSRLLCSGKNSNLWIYDTNSYHNVRLPFFAYLFKLCINTVCAYQHHKSPSSHCHCLAFHSNEMVRKVYSSSINQLKWRPFMTLNIWVTPDRRFSDRINSLTHDELRRKNKINAWQNLKSVELLLFFIDDKGRKWKSHEWHQCFIADEYWWTVRAWADRICL